MVGKEKMHNVLTEKIQFSPKENLIPVESRILKNEDFITKPINWYSAKNIEMLGFSYTISMNQ